MGFKKGHLLSRNAKRRQNDSDYLVERGEERKAEMEAIKRKYGRQSGK